MEGTEADHAKLTGQEIKKILKIGWDSEPPNFTRFIPKQTDGIVLLHTKGIVGRSVSVFFGGLTHSRDCS